MGSFSGGAREFRSAGNGGQRGRPSTVTATSAPARALIAARRHRKAMVLSPGGGENINQSSSTSSAETNAIRGAANQRQRYLLTGGE